MADERLEIAIKAVNEASKALKDVQKDLGGLDDAAKKSSSGLGNLSNAAKGAAVAGIGALTGALVFAIDQAKEAEVIMAKTNAVIKSTGGAAGLTAEEVADMAGEFAAMTGIDDELIQSAENVLLTFTSIGEEVFPRAMQAALDMSTALGTDLQSSVIMIGKALQDPVKGMTALRKAGVNVNEEMKKTVKNLVAAGKESEAMAFILSELETEFGGVAAAAGDTLAGKMGKAEVAIGNFAQAVGEKLIPMLGTAADAAVTLLTWTDNLNDVFEEHKDEVALTADGYEAYRDEVLRSAVQVGKLSAAELEALKANQLLASDVEIITNSLGIMSETTFRVTREMDAMNMRADEGTRALAAMKIPVEEVVFTEEELEKQAAATEKELARQAETLRKSREASAAAAEGFFGLAQAYADGVTKMEQVKAAITGLDAAQKSGAITADERTQAERELLLQFGLVTEASLSQARAQQELNVLLQGGKIDTDEYKEAMLKIPSAANDGRVTMEELGEAVGRASSQMNDAAQRAEQLRDRVAGLESKEITITTVYREIIQQVMGTAGTTPGGGRQHGGPVTAGGMYRVHPPEMFFPQESGFIMSQADTRHMLTLLESIAGGIGGMGTNVNVGVSGDRLSQAIDVTLARRARAARLSGMRGLT